MSFSFLTNQKLFDNSKIKSSFSKVHIFATTKKITCVSAQIDKQSKVCFKPCSTSKKKSPGANSKTFILIETAKLESETKIISKNLNKILKFT